MGRFLRKCWALLGTAILWVARVIGGVEFERKLAEFAIGPLQFLLILLAFLTLLWLIFAVAVGVRRWRERRQDVEIDTDADTDADTDRN